MTSNEVQSSTASDNTEALMRERIIHVLTIYPKISRSMLQVGIGTSMPPAIWKPVFEKMIREGIILETAAEHMTPGGRHQSYAILQLNGAEEATTTTTEAA